MKLLPRFGRHHHSAAGDTEAETAIKRTQTQDAQVARRWPAIRTIVQEVESHRDGNHFGDRIAEAYRGRLT